MNYLAVIGRVLIVLIDFDIYIFGLFVDYDSSVLSVEKESLELWENSISAEDRKTGDGRNWKVCKTKLLYTILILLSIKYWLGCNQNCT